MRFKLILLSLLLYLGYISGCKNNKNENKMDKYITEEKAIEIAKKRLESYFDIENMRPQAKFQKPNWVVNFHRFPPTPGGEPRVTIDALTGEIIEVFSTQ